MAVFLMTTPEGTFKRVAIIGIGLIGSSIACALREYELADEIVCGDANPSHVKQAIELGIVDDAFEDNTEAVEGADLVVLCTPVGSLGMVATEIGKHLSPGCIVTDVGSVKQDVFKDASQVLPKNIHFIPGHPIAGTEESGPAAGFAELFQGRWCILTPPENTNSDALNRLKYMWESCGAKVGVMTPEQHDMVLAATSHLPQLVAYAVVSTAADISESSKQEVMKFSAGGFRDVTRIAASDPVMWRDIFIHNREAALGAIDRFSENLSYLRAAIKDNDGDKLKELFGRAQKAKKDSAT